MEPLSYEVEERMVQCFGRCFYYKKAVKRFLISAGVPERLADRYSHEPKFVWARNVLDELSRTEDGRVVQRKLLTQLVNLRALPDDGVVDRDGGLRALSELKDLAGHLVAARQEEDERAKVRTHRQAERAARISHRNEVLKRLHAAYCDCVVSPDRQASGYALEDLLAELFAAFEIDFHPPYRTETQQVDGYFVFGGFHYLVEAKWRVDMPTEGEVGSFERKVRTKLQSTRGLFVSIPGFRPAVTEAFSGCGGSLIFMNGQSLALVLEGRWDLGDALRCMVDAASKRGIAHFPLG